MKLEDDELVVNIEDDDVFLAVYGDDYDSFYNVKEYIDPVYILNAVNSDSVSYEEAEETIEKNQELYQIKKRRLARFLFERGTFFVL